MKEEKVYIRMPASLASGIRPGGINTQISVISHFLDFRHAIRESLQAVFTETSSPVELGKFFGHRSSSLVWNLTRNLSERIESDVKQRQISESQNCLRF